MVTSRRTLDSAQAEFAARDDIVDLHVVDP
jgi:hypothetical protein